MNNQVLYRKHRPKSFEEVVGQGHVVLPITNAIRMDKIAHAYLFSGPRGTGKTTIARLIAKAANCANLSKISEGNFVDKLSVRRPVRQSFSVGGSLGEGGLSIPCNSCDPCVQFNEGKSFDVIEIDAASNTGVDDMRELREAVRFVPAGGNKKTYIIDEVHMLSKGAFNALLKTLEEPPEHAIFVLATTELEKVPATIVSRTQHYEFRRPSMTDIVRRLKTVAELEKVALESQAAQTIAFVAEGSLRDAESILGKILAVENKKITEEEINETLGIPRRILLREMVTAAAAKDRKRLLELASELTAGGYDYSYAVKMLIQYFRNMLLLKIDPSFVELARQEMPEEDIAFIREQGGRFSDLRVKNALASLIDAMANFKKSPIPQLPLELALLEIVEEGKGNEQP
ncbi:MAG: DNA polymerase III subunit gamma/tau [Candidatus Sungbacteria bacterium]|nr:DNA polymerase III subunit gamma/tau [Candidatus Sungbacteria bacterium]